MIRRPADQMGLAFVVPQEQVADLFCHIATQHQRALAEQYLS
jgi:cold shock CspA family protein